MKTFVITKPHLPKELRVVRSLDQGTDFLGVQVEGYVLTRTVSARLKIEESLIASVELTGAKLPKLDLADVIIRKCLLSGIYSDGASWLSVELHDCQLAGAILSDALIKHTLFRGVKLDMVNLRFAKLHNVVFEDCSCREADLCGTELGNVSFKNCDLTQADFSSVKCDNVDLRSSNLEDMKGISSLTGATISETQLISLSYALAASVGFKVE